MLLDDIEDRLILVEFRFVVRFVICGFGGLVLVLIFLGHDVVEARKEGLAEKPEGEAFRTFLAAPVEDAKALLKERFPANIRKKRLCLPGAGSWEEGRVIQK